MPVDIAMLGAVAALIMPVYAALWRIHKDIGSLDIETDVNSEDVDSVAEGVEKNRERLQTVEDDLTELRAEFDAEREAADS